MTDIVERLHTAIAHMVCESDCDLDKVMAEAADEIERLREENKSLLNKLSLIPYYRGSHI